MQSYLVIAQEPWVFQNNFGFGHQILESYDGGTVIAATEEGQSNIGKIIKVNKIGEILWEHTFEEGSEGVMPICMVEDVNGDLIIGGKTFKYESEGGSFLMRLNSCGELLWFNNLGIVGQLDYVRGIVLAENGSVVFNIMSENQRYILQKVDASGISIWISNLELNNTWSGDPNTLKKCHDGGYILGGDVYAPPYYDQSSTGGYLRGVVVKTDSLGSLEWFNVHRWSEDTIGSLNLSITTSINQLKNGSYNVLGINRNHSNQPPMMYELSDDGELLWHKSIAKPDTCYSNSASVLLPDSTIIVAISTSLPTDSWTRHLELYKMDLQANKLDEYIDETISTHQRDLRLSPDSSALYVLPGAAISPNGDWSLYALKLNPYTMELDTFITNDDSEYDYYCPEGVDELNYNFPELAIEDVFVQDKKQLRIAPNPAKNYTYVYFDITNFNRSSKIEIHCMQGQLVNSTSILARTGCLYEDLNSYTSGLYVVSLIMDNKLIESRKMIVE